MPELPEVETIVRGLRVHFLNRRIRRVQLTGHPVFEGDSRQFCKRLAGRSIAAVDRYGKSIYLSLKNKDSLELRVHLGMTGQMLVKDPSDPIQSHTHLVFEFDDAGKNLHYRDIRRFGEMEILEDGHARPTIPDAWTAPPSEILTALKTITGFLKHGLLNQKAVMGLGNIYVDEALHKAKLHPKKAGKNLRPQQWDVLAGCIRNVLSASIGVGGTSFSNYVDVYGTRGGFKGRLSVYGKTGEQCSSCKTRIKKIVVAGRGTHFCPKCQPSPR